MPPGSVSQTESDPFAPRLWTARSPKSTIVPPPRAVQIVVRGIVAILLGSIWVLGAAMFVTGAILWRDWHALARGGVDLEARIAACTFESTNRSKLMMGGSGNGYYSCHYAYRPDPSGPGADAGYFQSQGELRAGYLLAIRYRPDAPSVSAALVNTQHPSVAPVAMMLIPLVYAGWMSRDRVRRLVGRRPRNV